MIGHLYRYPHPFDPTRFIYVGQGSKRDKDHRVGRSSFGRRFKNKFTGVELPQPIREEIEVQNWIELNELETIWMFQYHTWRFYKDGMNLSLPGSQDYKNTRALVPLEALQRGGSKGGKISGRANVENGHLDRIRKLPQTAATHIKQGALLGRKAVESGLIKSLPALSAKWTENNKEEACKNASAGGCKSRDLKRGVHRLSLEESIINGRKGGMVALKSGQVQQLGRRNAESGRLMECSHIRWHVNRGIVSSSCTFCKSN